MRIGQERRKGLRIEFGKLVDIIRSIHELLVDVVPKNRTVWISLDHPKRKEHMIYDERGFNALYKDSNGDLYSLKVQRISEEKEK